MLLKVVLSNKVPSILIDYDKREKLKADLDARLALSKVFKDGMLVFYPLDMDWAKRNADRFFELCPTTINAVRHFLNENKPNGVALFEEKHIRKALREKCADVRKRIRAMKSVPAEFEFLFDDLDAHDMNGVDDEDDVDDPPAKAFVTKKAPLKSNNEETLEQTFNDTLVLNGSIDESVINAPISKKNRIESDGSLSSLLSTKKSKHT